MKPITVLIADDHATLRQGLRFMLDFEEGIEVMAEAADGREAVQLAKRYRPDVVVMDIAMPVISGIEATREICRELPNTRVLVVSAAPDEEQVQESLAAGARAFIAKQTSITSVPAAIREISRGNTFVETGVADARLESRRQRIGYALAQLGCTGTAASQNPDAA